MTDTSHGGTNWRWFSAEKFVLVIDNAKHVPEMEAASDAILLDEYAMLLHAVSIGTGTDHDWIPTVEQQSSSLTHSFILKESNDMKIDISLDGRLLNVESILDFVDIVEHRQPCEFGFEPFQIEEKEQQGIGEAECLILIPTSFNPIAECQISNDKICYSTELNMKTGDFKINSLHEVDDTVHELDDTLPHDRANDGSDDCSDCHISLVESLILDTKNLAAPTLSPSFGRIQEGQKIVGRIENKSGQMSSFAGQLVKVGNGFGALVTSWS